MTASGLTGFQRGQCCPVCAGRHWALAYHRLGWSFVRCDACGLVRLDPVPSEDELAEHYANRAASGNYEPERSPERDHGLSQVLAFAERVGATPGRLLDIGCFDGRFLDLATARGWTGWGIELQEEAARSAELRHPGRILRTPLEACDEVDPDGFDLITAIGLIEHLREPRSLFAIARHSLRPGGLLVVQTPNLRSAPARLLGRFWPPIAPPEHTYYFDRITLRRISERHGLRPVLARPHVKRLRLVYAYEQFRYFGPEFHRLLGPLMRVAPARLQEARLPMYGGELLFAASQPSGLTAT